MSMCMGLCRISVRSWKKKAGCRKPRASEAIKSLQQYGSYSQDRLLALCGDVECILCLWLANPIAKFLLIFHLSLDFRVSF